MPRFRTSRSGSTSSRTPNLFLGAIPTQQLRQYHANFVGLPPVEQLVVQQPDTFRYVRQEERLWEELHAGLITSGKLPDALGLRSSQAVQLLGGFKDSGAVERAWRHSLLPRWQGRLQPSPPHLAPDPAAPHAAADLAHNEAQRIRAYCSKQGLEALPEGGLWGEEEQRRQRQLCLQVAAEGSTACRLLWGSVQEGAALHALGQLFPHSWVEEVGLLAVAEGQLPGGITGAELPALAASPDATISHALPLTWKQVEAARQRVREAAGQASSVHLPGSPPGPPCPSSTPPGSLTPPPHLGAEAQALQLVQEALASLTATGPGHASAQQHAAAAAALGPAPPLTYSNAAALAWLAAVVAGSGTSFLDAGGVVTPPAAATPPTPQGRPGGVPVLGAGLGGGGWPAAAGTGAGAGGVYVGSGGVGGAVAWVDPEGCAWLVWREAVEVKSSCPFRRRDESDPGSYHLKDWGPLSQPRTAWVPQLQLHCLAAATSSVLLLSRSAGQGVTLFRMFRHDPYLAYMLGILRQLHLDYAARGCAPPPDLFNSPSMQPQHDALVTATMELSGTAVMVASRPGPFNGGPGALTAAPGSSSAAFLEQ